MLSATRVLYWAEGATDRAVARKLIIECGGIPGPDYSTRSNSAPGKDKLDQKLHGFNGAAAREPFLVLRDFDGDAICPGALVKAKLPKRAKFMCFRIVVPEIEAWIMADRTAFCAWLGVAEDQIPQELEQLSDAKALVLRLAVKSPSKGLKQDLLPRTGSGRREGPLYAARLIEFVSQKWNPGRAAASGRVPALARAIERLQATLSSGSAS